MLALLLALQAAPAQTDTVPRVTLAEALQRSARLDPFYVAALGQIDNAQWGRRNAFAVFILPAVTIGASMQRSDPPSFLFTDSLVRAKTLWTANLVARYDLFTGGQKIAELTRSAAALESARADELRQRFITAQLTEADYYAVLANAELDRVARDPNAVFFYSFIQARARAW